MKYMNRILLGTRPAKISGFCAAAFIFLLAPTALCQQHNSSVDRLLPGDMDPARALMWPVPNYQPGSDRFDGLGRLSNGAHPDILQLLGEITQAEWVDWLEKLSGAKPVTVGGQQTTITTRYSYALFNPDKENARAYSYVLEQVQAWVPSEQIEEDAFTYNGNTWKNLIVTLPGSTLPDEVLILCAHLDSYSNDPLNLAPGAEDNGSGSATLLLAAHWLATHKYRRTVRLIWFTGEEQGLIGSKAYLSDHAGNNIVGAINLDMFGYDSDNDRCFELHVGDLPASNTIGQHLMSALTDYRIPLNVDYLTDEANRSGSDHVSFWARGIGAVLVLENYSANRSTNGCGGRIDRNPHYHKTTDTTDKMRLDSSFDIARAAIATLAVLAEPLQSAPKATTLISPSGAISTFTPSYTWNAVYNATWYHLWVNDPEGKTITTWCTAAQAGCETGTGTCSLTPSVNLSTGRHTWWVQTWNPVDTGPWSEALVFFVGSGGLPGAARLISPSGTITAGEPVFTWDSVSNSSWYYLWVNGPTGTPIAQKWYRAAQVGCGSGAGACYSAAPVKLGAGQYSWWIQTWNGFGYGPWSSGLSFVVPPFAPAGKRTF